MPRSRAMRAWMLALPLDVLGHLATLLYTVQYWKAVVFAAALTVFVFSTGGLYRPRRHVSFLEELPALCIRLLTCLAVVAIIAATRHDSVEYVGGMLQVMACGAGLVLAGRALSRFAVRLARRRRWVEQEAVVVGDGPVGRELGRLLQRYPQYGLRFVGLVGAGSDALGGLDRLADVIATSRATVMIIADVECTDSQLLRIARMPAVAPVDLWVVPRLRQLHKHGGIADHIGAIPVVQIRRPALTGASWAAKRTFDVVTAVLLLVVLSPVLLLCGLAVRIEGGPGVFFRQQRVGRYGKLFDLIKFRSMRPADEGEAQTTWSIVDDPRVGPVGRFLRRTSLDELPQLWNILRGDMTFVGPRPERPYFVDRFSADDPSYAMRHRVPVGLTGLAQVSGLRGDTPITDRARFDNYYIENWSLWLDIKVLMRTVAEVLRGGGA